MTTTVEELIATRGGPTQVARALGVKPARVAMWKLRKQIPRSFWPELVDVYPEITLDDLRRTERTA